MMMKETNDATSTSCTTQMGLMMLRLEDDDEHTSHDHDDDEANAFVPLRVGQFLGRTPETMKTLLSDLKELENDATERQKYRKQIKQKRKKLETKKQQFPLTGLLIDNKAVISKKCLQVVDVSSCEGWIELKRLQKESAGRTRMPVKVLRSINTDEKPDVVPDQTVRLYQGDVLEILDKRFRYQVAREELQLPASTETEMTPSQPVSDESLSNQNVTPSSHEKRTAGSLEIDQESPSNKKQKLTTPMPPSFCNPEWVPRDEDLEEDLMRTTPADSKETMTAGSSDDSQSLLLRAEPPCTTMNMSAANTYWNGLNASAPHIGAMFLNAVVHAAHQLPTQDVCDKWMALLTWGPMSDGASRNNENGRNEKKDDVHVFFWDGPRLNKAMKSFEMLLQTYPTTMIPRFVQAAGKEWWKTVLEDLVLNQNNHVHCYNRKKSKSRLKRSALRERILNDEKQTDNDDGDENENDNVEETAKQTERIIRSQEAEEDVIDTLRMQSCSLQALTVLLQSSLQLLFKQQQRQRQRQHHTTSVDVEGDQQEDSDTDDDDDDDEEEASAAAVNDFPSTALALLQEIREYGAKPALQLVARVIAHVWTTQRRYLIWELANEDDGESGGTVVVRDMWFWETRTDLVETIVKQLATLLALIWKVVSLGDELSLSSSLKQQRRPRRGRSRNHGCEVTETEVRQILWNTMHMQVEEKLKGRCSSNIGSGTYSTSNTNIDALLIRWIRSLQEPLGDNFVRDLAVQAGVSEEYEEMMRM